MPKFLTITGWVSFSLFFTVLNIAALHAQTYSISGIVKDKRLSEELIGANVVLYALPDSNQAGGTVSDIDGSFLLQSIKPGRYVLKVSYLGYHTVAQPVTLSSQDIKGLEFSLEEDARVLQEVEVEAIMPRMVLKDDTVQLNADAYKVNPDATASDLVTKMPGIVVQDGKIQAQGEDVKKVLVDGKEFFGEDAVMALKNLPADIVDKVQVFDRLSDQAQFTGFNDGNTEKTINIVTKGQVRDGLFGRVYAGYGTDNRYQAGGNLNYFKDTRRFSVVGLSNNINVQNFSSEDLVGVASSGGSSNRAPGSGPRQAGGGSGGPGGGGDNAAGNFLVGQQGGISKTNGIGVNYVEEWKESVKLSASYFFNNSKNDYASVLERMYFTGSTADQQYNENRNSETNNFNHRINARLEYKIDTNKSLIVTPRLSFQHNNSGTLMDAVTAIVNGMTLSRTDNDNSAVSKGLSFSNGINYRQKLGKQGRTYSIRLETSYNDRHSDDYLLAENYYSENIDSLVALDQWTNRLSKTLTIGGELNYTEPVGKKGQLQLSYNPSMTRSSSDKLTNQYDVATGEYRIVDSTLSNVFDNTNWAHKAGVSYRFNSQKFNFNIGANYQFTSLLSDRTFPVATRVEKYYHNFLPNGHVAYNISRTSNVRLFYRTSVRAPNVTQLQDVIDNSNPLLLSAGNKDLDQQYSHFLGLRFRNAQPAKGTSTFLFIGGGVNNNYITNSTFIATRDTMITADILLPAGGQLTRPVNVDGNWNLRSFFTYGTPLLFMKSNMNLSAGFTYLRTPNLINDVMNTSNTYNFNAGVLIGSNISEKVDFRVGYNAGYNIVKYTLQRSGDNNYYSGAATAMINVLPWKGMVIGSDIAYTHFAGLGEDFNNNYALWNASVGYKFLKNRAAEIRIQVFDILGVNNSISRTVTETYVEDSQVNVLDRYFMLQFSYKFNRFSASDKR